jgi:hypothetical protein
MSERKERSNQVKLKETIIGLSENKDWHSAKLEWTTDIIWWHASHCACDHDIMENIRIVNTINGNTCVVGNVCLFQFLGWDLSCVFACVRSMRKDILTPWNAALAVWVGYKKWFTGKEMPLAMTHCCGAIETKAKKRDRELRTKYNLRILAMVTGDQGGKR